MHRSLIPALALALTFSVSPLLSQVLTLEEATAWAMQNHPMALAAEAVELRGPAELLRARGAFDPTLQGGFERKDYLGSEYFTYTNAGLEWQSPYAFKLEGGRESAEGIFINPEQTVPEAGQAYLSVKLPLLQGLLYDKYRGGVDRAEASTLRNLAAAEIIRNELRYDIAVAYTNWALARAQVEVYRETQDLLLDYLRNTRGLVAQGDKPAVDTLEASIYFVEARLDAEQAAVDAQVASQDLLALYFPLDQNAVPTPDFFDRALPQLDLSVVGHPQLAEIRASFAELEVERRIKREYLKPKLDVGYSILGDGFNLAPQDEKVEDRSLFTRAYKVSADFRYPILNRTARGDVQLTDIKLAETGGKLEAKRQELVAKAQAYANAALSYEAQISEVNRLIDQSRGLLEAERQLFQLGESTQFLLNQRAQNLQKARITRAKLLSLRLKAIWSWRQATARWE